MDKGNQKKYDQLGMPHGTAMNRLRKSIMFQMAQELGKDICFRCGEKIDSIESLSIEHKEAWQLSENPYKSFFDLGNIAFSHLHCNISSGSKHYAGHGQRGMYHNGCRCNECQEWKSINNKKYEHRIGAHK